MGLPDPGRAGTPRGYRSVCCCSVVKTRRGGKETEGEASLDGCARRGEAAYPPRAQGGASVVTRLFSIAMLPPPAAPSRPSQRGPSAAVCTQSMSKIVSVSERSGLGRDHVVVSRCYTGQSTHRKTESASSLRPTHFPPHRSRKSKRDTARAPPTGWSAQGHGGAPLGVRLGHAAARRLRGSAQGAYGAPRGGVRWEPLRRRRHGPPRALRVGRLQAPPAISAPSEARAPTVPGREAASPQRRDAQTDTQTHRHTDTSHIKALGAPSPLPGSVRMSMVSLPSKLLTQNSSHPSVPIPIRGRGL